MPSPFFLFLLLLFFLSPAPPLAGSHSFHYPPPQSTNDNVSCLTFLFPPSSPALTFPFSAVPGHGHPSFQIRCSGGYPLLVSISSFLFRVPGPTSLLVAPLLSPGRSNTSTACPPPILLLPSSPVNLSSSPFYPTAAFCHSLSALPRLRDPSSPCTSAAGACLQSLSHWQRRLLSRPQLLFPSCSDSQLAPSSSLLATCNSSYEEASIIAGAIVDFLRQGVRLYYNLSADPYALNCSRCSVSGGVCGFNESLPGKPFLCLNASNDGRPRQFATPGRLLILTTTLFAVACLLLVALSLFAAAASLQRRGGDVHNSDASATAAFLLRHRLRPPVYTYDRLRDSTGGFDPRRKIGDGGFGSVYLASLDGGRVAAVKRLHRHHPAAAATRSFCNEILILSSLRHPNLVRLHGYCCDPRGLLLVYDYIPNGTLADHLHGPACSSGSPYVNSKPVLSWAVRVDVALQTAGALEYLHFAHKPPVVHRDVTSSNIFVENDMRVKLGDFGLSRLLTLPPGSSSSPLGSSSEYVRCTGPQGTPGYLDPEYHRSFRLTEKSDVYSFGVVLLELVTGMKAVDVKRDRSEVTLVDMVVSKIHVGTLHQVVDPALLQKGQEVMTTVEAVAELAFRCVAGDKDDRPDARELVKELKRIWSRIDAAADR